MEIVVFGLSVSSSWGNGHATLWRGLVRGLAARGHRVVFYERDVPYYAEHRDLGPLPGLELRLYRSWDDVRDEARARVAHADVAMVTSFCPDGASATELVLDASRARRVFYDLDTPVTLDALANGAPVPYLGPRGLVDFDLVLSYTGGAALSALVDRLGARRVAPLYGSVDPDVHRPFPVRQDWRCALSYLGTYAPDRQPAVDALFLEPARLLPAQKFLLGGSMYPADFPWTPNVFYVPHVAPPDHAAFYSSSRFTLSTTRRAMAAMGFCPSGRLFEAAACGTPILTDRWEGLERFFEPGHEILVVDTADDVLEALAMPDAERDAIAARARARAIEEHSAYRRAGELAALLEETAVDDRMRDGPPGALPASPRPEPHLGGGT